MCMNGLHVSMCATCLPGAQGQIEYQIPWDRRYRQLPATAWVLGPELESSTRATSALNHCAFSLAPDPSQCFFTLIGLGRLGERTLADTHLWGQRSTFHSLLPPGRSQKLTSYCQVWQHALLPSGSSL